MTKLCRFFDRPPSLRGPDDVARLFRDRWPADVSGLVVLGLLAERRATGAAYLARSLSHSALDTRVLASCAFELTTPRLVTVWVLGAGHPAPSLLEVDAGVELGERCRSAGLVLVDSIVISGHRWWSLREMSGSATVSKHVKSCCRVRERGL